MSNFLIDDFEASTDGRRSLAQVVLYERSRIELDTVQKFGTGRLLNASDAIRLALSFAAQELTRRVLSMPIAEPSKRRTLADDPMGWKIGYKTSGKIQLEKWINDRIQRAKGDELAMLQSIANAGYVGRMNVLREYWRARE